MTGNGEADPYEEEVQEHTKYGESIQYSPLTGRICMNYIQITQQEHQTAPLQTTHGKDFPYLKDDNWFSSI